MIISPCNHCHLTASCEIKTAKLKAVYGLRLTKMGFRCDVRKKAFSSGMKVAANLKYVAVGMTDGGYDNPSEPITEERTVDAVVMGWSTTGKVRIFVPYEPDGAWWLASYKTPDLKIHVLLIHPEQLVPSADFVSVCTDCGLPEDADLAEWNCGLSPEDGGCATFTEASA